MRPPLMRLPRRLPLQVLQIVLSQTMVRQRSGSSGPMRGNRFSVWEVGWML